MRKLLAFVLFAVFASSPVFADDAHHKGALTDGEIRKVDKDAQKITIRHGPIKNLDMPGMTMVFRVKDATLLDAAKAGDKVMFRAEQEGGQYFVISIEPSK